MYTQSKNLDNRIRNLPSIAYFKRAILDFMGTILRPMFKINRLLGFAFLTRLNVSFSHLREHTFVALLQLKIVN